MVAGVCGGLIVALGALFVLTVVGVEVLQSTGSPGKWSFFSVWAASVALVLSRRNSTLALDACLLAAGALLVAAALISIARGAANPTVREVDALLLVLGSALLAAGWRLFRRRSLAAPAPAQGSFRSESARARARPVDGRARRFAAIVLSSIALALVTGALVALAVPGSQLDRAVAGALASLVIWVTATVATSARLAPRVRPNAPHAMSRRRALYDVHSATGAVVGVALFVICATGTVAVFRDELRVWSSPKLRALETRPEPTLSVDQALERFARRYDLGTTTLAAVRLPGLDNPAYELLVPRTGSGGVARAYLHPTSGRFLGESRHELGDFLFQLHSNLSFRSKLGRYVVGLGGVALLFLAGTGVLVHGRLLRGLLTMRWNGSRRVVLSDAHKAIGTWGLLFHALIGFTGAFLALKGLLVAVPAAVIHGGSLKAARGAFSDAPTTRTGEPAPMMGVGAMVARARREVPAIVPTLVVLQAFGDRNARVEIAGMLPGSLLPRNEAARVRFEGSTGKMLSIDDGAERSAWQRVLGAMTPLHYGDFAGGWLRALYFVLGSSATVLSMTGLSMWLERRLRTRAAAGPNDEPVQVHRSLSSVINAARGLEPSAFTTQEKEEQPWQGQQEHPIAGAPASAAPRG